LLGKIRHTAEQNEAERRNQDDDLRSTERIGELVQSAEMAARSRTW